MPFEMDLSLQQRHSYLGNIKFSNGLLHRAGLRRQGHGGQWVAKKVEGTDEMVFAVEEDWAWKGGESVIAARAAERRQGGTPIGEKEKWCHLAECRLSANLNRRGKKINEDAVLHDSGSGPQTKDPNVVKRVGEEGKESR